MLLKEVNFNRIRDEKPFEAVGLCIKADGKEYNGFIGEVLKTIPVSFAERVVKETRWFFNVYVIELM